MILSINLLPSRVVSTQESQLSFLLPLRKRRWKWRAVLVRGPSMAPTLRHGDAVLVRHGGRPVQPEDIVVARFHSRPELLVVKRAVRQEEASPIHPA
jgi:phage repressor protein C with HTH and peptisase S24 domain